MDLVQISRQTLTINLSSERFEALNNKALRFDQAVSVLVDAYLCTRPVDPEVAFRLRGHLIAMVGHREAERRIKEGR